MTTKAAPRPAPAAEAPLQLNGNVTLAEIRPCPFNVRRHFDSADLAGLAESIDRIGLKDPLLVRPIDAKGQQVPLAAKEWRKKTDHFELADGERRFRALSLLAETKDVGAVPVIVRNLTDEEVRAIMLASREQSRELSVSELVAGYAELRAKLPDDAALAAMVGRPVAHVRSVLRLGKLPAWALAAVDAGTLPRATAELVARVPGEESKAQCAALVLHGFRYTEGVDVPDLVRTVSSLKNPDPLSYREAKELIRDEFQIELKGAPFGRKELYIWPGCEPGHERNMPDCEGCPSRAANNEEAKAEGTRGDVCLDVGCYRAKVEAHDARSLAKGAKKGWMPIPEDLAWPQYMESPPKGWCDVEAPAQLGDLSNDFAGSKKGEEKLGKLLGVGDPLGGAPAVYATIDPRHKLRGLVKTADARRMLQAKGVLKKPERVKEKRTQLTSAERVALTQPKGGKPAGPSAWEVDERAAQIAAKVLREYTEDQCSALDEHEDSHEEGPIRGALELACRAVCYEWSRSREGEKLLREWVVPDGDFDSGLDAAICAMTPSQVIALLVAVAAWWETNDGPNRPTGQGLLAFAELDWSALQEQARRELSGGETAEEELEKAASPIVHCPKCKATYDATGRTRCPSCGRVGQEPAEAATNVAESETAAETSPHPAAAEVVIGSVVRTSYGTGPYVVDSIMRQGQRIVSLALRDQSPPKGKKNPALSHLNGVERHADGRFTSSGGQDELIVLPPGTDGGPTYWDWIRDNDIIDGSDDERKKLHRAWMLGELPRPTAMPAGTPLATIPNFPAAALEQLQRHNVLTLESLDAKVAEIARRPGQQNANRYDAMRELNVPGEAVLDAGDAIIDHEQAAATKDKEQAKPAPKAKARKGGKAR